VHWIGVHIGATWQIWLNDSVRSGYEWICHHGWRCSLVPKSLRAILLLRIARLMDFIAVQSGVAVDSVSHCFVSSRRTGVHGEWGVQPFCQVASNCLFVYVDAHDIPLIVCMDMGYKYSSEIQYY